MKHLPCMLAALVLGAVPAAAQNLALPAGSLLSPNYVEYDAEAAAPAPQPEALRQGRSAYERHDALRHRRSHH